jgi:hypothetical protein
MKLVRHVAVLAALNTVLAVSTFACGDEEYSHLFQDVNVVSAPSIVGPDGAAISTTWTGNAISRHDSFRTTLNAKNGMRLSLDFGNPQPATTFTRFKLRKFDDIFGANVPPGEMQIAFLDTSKRDVTSVTGSVRVEVLDAPEEERFRLKIVFDDLRMSTDPSGGSTSTRTIVPLALDGGGFVATDGGGYAWTGYTWKGPLETTGDSSMTKLDTSSSSSSSSTSSSSSSSGGSSDCSKAWSCSYDQATSICQQACSDSTNRAKYCAVLKSMVDTYPNRCCAGCK